MKPDFSAIKKRLVEQFGELVGIQKFLQFEKSITQFAQSKFLVTPPEALATREATCRDCPEWDPAALNATGRCRKCGCSTWAKLRMATEACPLGKWSAMEVSSLKSPLSSFSSPPSAPPAPPREPSEPLTAPLQQRAE